MGSPSLITFYLAWGSILLLNISSAVSFPGSSIIEATKEKYTLLRSRHLQFASSNTPLTLEQFDLCMTDLKLADSNADSQLDKSEYLLFLSINSAKYGYAWGDASNQFSLSELPLEFAMLFHSTACMCAYEQDSASVDFGCCQGANEHVAIYADSGSNMTEEQETYSRLFCSEAYYSYSSTFSVSTIPPNTAAPDTSPPTPTMTSPPVMPLTASPTQRVSTIPPNTVAPGTSPPTPTITSLSMSPTASSTIPPNTVAPGTSPPTPTITSLPMSPTASSTIEIDIEYGISSDCGMTAYDVMNGNYGITIKEGLITAAEVVLVEILNNTYPRQEATEGVVETALPQSIPTMPPVTVLDSMPPVANSGSIPTMPPAISSFSIPTMPPAAGGEDPSAMAAETTNKKFLKTVRIRVEGLPSAPVKVGNDDPYYLRRGLAMLSVPEGQPQSLRGDYWPLNKHHQLFRSLVYYTEQNPIIITNVEDVSDQSCPIGIVCMKVKSTVFVTLEEGDVANDVEAVIRSGFELSLEDYSFFDSMPDDTIVCPPPSSDSPIPTSINSSEPTSPSPAPVVLPATYTPTSIPISSSEPTSPPVHSLTPVAISTTPPSIAATPTTLLPFPTAVTESPSSGSEEGPTGPMNVTIQYNFNNDCGLDAEAIMNEEGNTFKDVLVDVTTAATIQILNETFPSVKEEEPARRRGFRGLVHLDNPRSTSFFSGQQRRNLVYYTDEYPVTIDRIIDIESCDPGFSCLLVISTIIVLLEAGDDPTQVNDAIVSGIADSFSDGSIYSTVPPESLECPSV